MNRLLLWVGSFEPVVECQKPITLTLLVWHLASRGKLWENTMPGDTSEPLGGCPKFWVLTKYSRLTSNMGFFTKRSGALFRLVTLELRQTMSSV